MKSGFLVINKKSGISSFDVVRYCKKKLQMKKIGHTGTLDPLTDGVLVLAIGKATKYIPIMSEEKVKVYRAQITFGEHRSTYDLEGEVLQVDNPQLSSEQIKDVMESFIGTYDQYPPIYSAKKVDGKRLYEYARNNQEVEIKPSPVKIIEYSNIGQLVDNKIDFEVKVSKGTYIRSLIVDIATKLNTVGYMSKLTRLESDGFTLDQAIAEEDISIEEIIDFHQFLLGKYPKVKVYGKIEKLVGNGFQFRPLPNQQYPLVYIGENNQPLALYDKQNEQQTKLIIMLKE